jgi:hypothetical protein
VRVRTEWEIDPTMTHQYKLPKVREIKPGR